MPLWNPAPIASTVFVLVIEHREGQDITVHQTDAGAKDYLAAYCREWWSESSDDPMPGILDDLIASYFEGSNERWSITQCWVREGK
jgi:hypothetical protein